MSAASITTFPRRGPGGMKISISSLRFSVSSASIFSYAEIRALLFGVASLRIQADPLQFPRERLLPLRFLLLFDRKAGAASVRATRSSSLRTGSLRRGPVRGSIRRRCRGSTGRASRRARFPGTATRCCSSQATDSASRWFVGSSSSRTSGSWRSSRHSATRRRSPPERTFTACLAGRASERVHRLFELAVEVPCVRVVDLFLEIRLLLQQSVEIGVRLAKVRC